MTLPNVSKALQKWKQDIVLIQISFTQGADLKKTIMKNEIPYKAIVQPLDSYKLKLESGGLRGLEWIMVHIEANSPVILKLNDRIKWGQKEFTIKELKNYANSFLQTNKDVFRSNNNYGYIQYIACELNEGNNTNYQIND